MTPWYGTGEATSPPPTYEAPGHRGICSRHRSEYPATLLGVVVASVVWLECPGSARRCGHPSVNVHVGGGATVGGGTLDRGVDGRGRHAAAAATSTTAITAVLRVRPGDIAPPLPTGRPCSAVWLPTVRLGSAARRPPAVVEEVTGGVHVQRRTRGAARRGAGLPAQPRAELVRASDGRRPRGVTDELWQRIAGLGWPGLLVPESHGGLGLGLVDMTVVMEEMGRLPFPGPFFSSAVLATLAARRLGADELLAGLASGTLRGTVALEEAGSRQPRRPGADPGPAAAARTGCSPASSRSCSTATPPTG